MLRKNIRLRKEYLHRRALEDQLGAITEKKKRLNDALKSGAPIPSDIRGEERALRKGLDLLDDKTASSRHIDDEYVNLGVEEPKILITTSRDPSGRLTQFLKEMRLLLPNAQRVNRGSYIMKDLIDLSRKNDVTDMVILHEHRGKPDGLIVCHLPQGPTAYFGLSDVVLRHDLAERPPNMSETKPHLIFDGFSGKLGKRTMTVLQALFPPAAPLGKRAISFVNKGDDVIHFRHHSFERKRKPDGSEDADITEIGPRFTMRLYRLELGTLEMPDVKVEWALRPFMNKQKRVLAQPQ